MDEQNVFTANEICKELNITTGTLNNWYRWEKNSNNNRLTTPGVDPHKKGKPRIWTLSMLNELKNYKENIVMGPNGIYGCYTNPNYLNTKKCRK